MFLGNSEGSTNRRQPMGTRASTAFGLPPDTGRLSSMETPAPCARDGTTYTRYSGTLGRYRTMAGSGGGEDGGCGRCAFHTGTHHRPSVDQGISHSGETEPLTRPKQKIPAASSEALRAGGHYVDLARFASTCPSAVSLRDIFMCRIPPSQVVGGNLRHFVHT